ncbi:PDGLE domain-containing protein, partial [Candidatus Bathyarchaeota archaeon]|nr:PDGLE domain-containing protein [Candidatus Bathyarchaeota archaeon]
MRGTIKALIIIILAFAILTPLASTDPDGLEKVAETLKVEEPEPLWMGVMPDYTMPQVENPYLSTVLAGFLGTLLVFGLSHAIGKT